MTDDTLQILGEIEKKVLWLASWTIHNANHLRDTDDGLKVGGHQASSASLAAIMTALYFKVLRPEDRVAVKPHASPIFHAIQYLLGKQTRERLETFPRLQGRAELSVAHQGCRRRRFLHRLGRPRRRANIVLVAGAGLCARAWLGLKPRRRPHDLAGRRCRARRGKYFRGAARRMEAGPAQLLVDRRLQPPEPRRGRARRIVGTLPATVHEFRLGRGDREIRLTAAGRVPRAGRRGVAALDRYLSQRALLGAGVPRRRGLAQASARRHRRSGRGDEADRIPLRRRTGAPDEQSRRPRSARFARRLRQDRSRPADLFHLLHHQRLRSALRRAQGQSRRADDGKADGGFSRRDEYPPGS